jgi:hypothetical protein
MLSRPNCKVCASEHRAGAEAMFRASGTLTAIQQWLVDAGDDLSYGAVKNHFAKHYLDAADIRPADAVPAIRAIDILGTLDAAHGLALRQVERLAATQTDERNIGAISAALFRGLDLLARQAELRARLAGYFDAADEPTLLQVEQLTMRLRQVVSRATPEQRALLQPVIEELTLLEGMLPDD